MEPHQYSQRSEDVEAVHLPEGKNSSQDRMTLIGLAQERFRALPKALDAAGTLEEVKAVVYGLTDVVGLLLQAGISEAKAKERALEQLHEGFPHRRNE